MHTNYFFLRILSKELSQKLGNARIADCFSQNKNELILALNLGNNRGLVYLKTNLNPDFNLLSMPSKIFRSKRNSITIFKEIISLAVEGVQVNQNDRSFSILLENSFRLLFKLYGGQSNVLLFKGEKVIELFRKKLVRDRNFDLKAIEKDVDYSYTSFQESLGNVDKLYPAFGGFVKEFIKQEWSPGQTLKEKWVVVEDVLSQLHSGKIYIIRHHEKPTLSLIRTGEILDSSDSAIEILNRFSKIFVRDFSIEKKSKEALSLLRKEERSLFNFISKAKTALEKLHGQENYKIFGDLIMANLNKIHPYDEKVSLQDFFSGKEVIIPLKRGVTAQKNAENYYRKNKNLEIQIRKTEENVSAKSREYQQVKVAIEKVEESNTIKEIEEIISPYLKVREKKSELKPYKSFQFMEYEIRVGRNARSNDETTFGFSHKDDLWLHVKDASGSHVIIKKKSGSKIPQPVIERAAQLAAFYSKRKTESLVPVSYTPKKFVRKRKGDPAGMVVLEKEQVILVQPEP